ncbi:hypothetical protein M405DRAFT_324443 [Rhizopogon salebrosus TDB-379]|nr:hypothetical protein M405DRAFT_324443 [Rhizopogon salebrosus TDB-379]
MGGRAQNSARTIPVSFSTFRRSWRISPVAQFIHASPPPPPNPLFKAGPTTLKENPSSLTSSSSSSPPICSFGAAVEDVPSEEHELLVDNVLAIRAGTCPPKREISNQSALFSSRMSVSRRATSPGSSTLLKR